MKTFFLSTGWLLAGLAQTVIAHPGHGLVAGHGDTLLHPVIGADQLLVLAATTALVYAAGRILARATRRDKE